MKTAILILGFTAFISYQSVGQNKVETDPSYSAYNYKHPNKAAYAKKHNLDRTATLGTIEVTENVNYKQSNKKETTRKAGVVSQNDKNKAYPNYKRPF